MDVNVTKKCTDCRQAWTATGADVAALLREAEEWYERHACPLRPVQ